MGVVCFTSQAFRFWGGRVGGQEARKTCQVMSGHPGSIGDWQHEYTPVTFPPSFSGHFLVWQVSQVKGPLPLSFVDGEHWMNTPF